MGLFTGASLSARPPTRQLKRRSLGGKLAAAASTGASSAAASAAPTDPSPNGRSTTAPIADLQKACSDCAHESLNRSDTSAPVRLDSSGDDEGSELDLADLRSDDALLYERAAPVDAALGLEPSHPPPPILDRIDVYVAEHYLDCFGITHRDELVRHHNRLIPFFARAPRFVSIHSLKQKELERDYTEVSDTADTCARRHLCQGRCLLGFACPQD